MGQSLSTSVGRIHLPSWAEFSLHCHCLLGRPSSTKAESQGRPKRAKWLPKHFHHTVCRGGTHPYHAIGPLNGPLLHSRAPNSARFGPERPFWGSWRSSGARWLDWVGVMATTHVGLVLGLFWVPRGPKRARFGPKGYQLGTS